MVSEANEFLMLFRVSDLSSRRNFTVDSTRGLPFSPATTRAASMTLLSIIFATTIIAFIKPRQAFETSNIMVHSDRPTFS